MKRLKPNIAILSFIALALACVADAAVPGHSLVSIAVPFILAAAALFLGLSGYRLKKADGLVLIILNAVFLILTYKHRIFILNLFTLSFLVWHFITPFLARSKAAVRFVFFALLFLSFAVPFYKLGTPLLPLLYYPFYISGYMLDSLKFKKNRVTTILCTITAIGSASALAVVFLKLLRINGLYNKVYIQSLFRINTLLVYAPFIVAGFLFLMFSILVLSTGIINYASLKARLQFNLRAAAYSSTAVLPLIYGLFAMHPGHAAKYGLLIAAVAAYVLLYLVAVRILAGGLAGGRQAGVSETDSAKSEIAAAAETTADKDVPGAETTADKDVPAAETAADKDAPGAAAGSVNGSVVIDVNKVFAKLFFILFYIGAVVISIEFVMRSGSLRSLYDYTKTVYFAYNILFVGICYVLIISILGVRLGTLITTIVHLALLIASYAKVRYFSEPFFPWDIYLISDAYRISRDYINIYVILALAAAGAALVGLIVKFRRNVLGFLKPRPDVWLAVFMVIPVFFNLQLLNNNGLKKINVFKDWYDGLGEYQRNGTYVEDTLYLQRLDRYFSTKPSDYSGTAMENIKKTLPSNEKISDMKPNVVVVLSETFWDPENLPNIKLNKQVDTYMNMYKSGTMLSPKFGGGTANIEFEVLTGLSDFFFNNSVIPYTIYFKRDTPGIVSAFNDNGYSTVAIHPNTGLMYNRKNVFKYLGFSKFEDISSFDVNKDVKGNYVSDDKFVDKILDTLNQGSGPKFVLGISMQNHDPYPMSIKKYGSDREIQVTSDKLNPVETDVLSNYAQGIYDADNALGKLIDGIKKSGKPTLVYYFGDHLPRLGLPEGIYDIYNKLGFTDSGINPVNDPKFYKTPLITWSNFKDMEKFTTPVSPNQLSVEILRDAGVKYPDYFNFLLELRDKHPWLNNYISNHSAIAEESIMKEYNLIQYDILFGKQYLVKK